MKVIKIIYIETVKCPTCENFLQYDSNDVHTENDGSKYIVCPVCKKGLTVE